MINRLRVIGPMVVLVLAALAPAQTFTTLTNFNVDSGSFPLAGVIQDQFGNLYGTTYGGCGIWGCGEVYKVDTAGTAGTETVLLAFCRHTACSDGNYPEAPLVRNKAGGFYGTTYAGGTGCPYYGCGVVFKVDTAGNKTLYRFTGKSDGCWPYQGLVVSEPGTVFGTTAYCGSSNHGTIFKVDNAGKFSILHSFTGRPSDGAHPTNGHLTMDETGNLYGVTAGGGAFGEGVLYTLSEKRRLTVLHSFGKGSDGCNPFGSVVQDKAGNFYGTTGYCGSHNYGTIWKVSKNGKETILHSFAGGASDGCYPNAGVARDSKGNLYGVTDSCGANGYGTLYELSPQGRLTLLHSFTGLDGSNPNGEVLRTSEGRLFGTTFEGGTGICGSYGCGTVWSYVP